MSLFKVLGPNGEAIHGGSGSWPLPDGDTPGDWLSIEGELVVCANALHLTPSHALLSWYRKESLLFLAEPDLSAGVVLEDNTKAGFRRARLTEEVTVDWPLLKLYPQAWVYLAMRDATDDKRADLSGAYLSGAYLSRAYLSGADLSGADLSGADLSGAYLSGAYMPSGAPDGWEADLSGYLKRVSQAKEVADGQVSS